MVIITNYTRFSTFSS